MRDFKTGNADLLVSEEQVALKAVGVHEVRKNVERQGGTEAPSREGGHIVRARRGSMGSRAHPKLGRKS